MMPPKTLVSSVLSTHVWIGSPGSSARVCVDVHGNCINGRLRGYLGYILPYVEMMVFGGHVANLAMVIWVICNTIKGHDVIWAPAVNQEPCLCSWSTTVWVCTVFDPCCQWRLFRCLHLYPFWCQKSILLQGPYGQSNMCCHQRLGHCKGLN